MDIASTVCFELSSYVALRFWVSCSFMYVCICFQWLQDSLAYLLKLMTQFSVLPCDNEVGGHDDMFDILESPVRKVRKHRMAQEKLVVPRLNQVNINPDC